MANGDSLVVDLTKRLIEINSENPPGREKEAAKFVRDYLDSIKIDPEIVEFDKGRSNVIASIGKGEGMMLCGHLDTVPCEDKTQMIGKIQKNRLYGRGSADMKGGVAAILASLKGLDLNKLNRRILLTFVADEEAGGKGTEWLLNNRKGTFKSVKYGIIAEPTNLAIQIAQKGILGINVNFSGRAAHGSRPWLGDNAIIKASEFIEKLNNVSLANGIKDALLGSNTVNIGKIRGGVAVNVVPSSCEVNLDIRTISPESTRHIILQVRTLANQIDKKSKCTVAWKKEAIKVSQNSEVVKILRSITNSKLVGSTFYTEAEMYMNGTGMDCTVFGPGDIKVCHTRNEYVNIRDLEKSEYTFKQVIRKWC